MLGLSVLRRERLRVFPLFWRARRCVPVQRSSAFSRTVKLHARWARLLLERRDPV